MDQVGRARCQNVNKIQETIELGIFGGLSIKKKITEDHYIYIKPLNLKSINRAPS